MENKSGIYNSFKCLTILATIELAYIVPYYNNFFLEF